MVQLSTILWVLIIMFAIVGLLRGWTREIVASAGIILALFASWQFDSIILQPLTQGATPQQIFFLYSGILMVLAFFAYQTPGAAAQISSSRLWADRRLGCQERLLGFVVGGVERLSALRLDLVLPGPHQLPVSAVHLLADAGQRQRLDGQRAAADLPGAGQSAHHPGHRALPVRHHRHGLIQAGRTVAMPDCPFDPGLLTTPGRRVHIVGIGGAGMSAIARVLIGRGLHVSGSDRAASAATSALESLGATIYEGHAAAHIAQSAPDVVLISSAVQPDNPEVQAAQTEGIPVLKRRDALPLLLGGMRQTCRRRDARQDHDHGHACPRPA